MSDYRRRHARWIEPHEAKPDLTRQYVHGGHIEVPCLVCGEAVIRHEAGEQP